MKKAKKKRSQEVSVLGFFRKSRNKSFTPFDVLRALRRRRGGFCGTNKWTFTPVTSIRRAITNLEKAGWLCKTGVKKQESYGRPNNTWRYAA